MYYRVTSFEAICISSLGRTLQKNEENTLYKLKIDLSSNVKQTQILHQIKYKFDLLEYKTG